MREEEVERIVRFFSFLPFGFSCLQALELSFPYTKNDPALVLYDPIIKMKDRLLLSEKEQKKRQHTIRKMQEYGYIETAQIKYDSHAWSEIRMHRLTKAGFNLLAGSPDSDAEIKRQMTLKEAGKRRIKEITYSPNTEDFVYYRNTLRTLADARSNAQEGKELYEKFFLESFHNGQLSLIAREPAIAETVSVIPSLKSSQIYTAWKLQNIEALFRANKFLTSLDRRQIESTRRQIDPIKLIEEGKKPDVNCFTRWVLDQWYRENPDSYLFRNPLPGSVDPASWKKIPAFYSLRELPGFESAMDEETTANDSESMNYGGSNSLLRHSSLGLAIGDISNYLVYHTTQKGNLWSINIERNVGNAAQRIVNMANENKPVSGANRTIRNAIIVCPSVHQFAKLFDVKEPSSNKWRKYSRVDAPFNSACIVPLNRSGTMQLKLLIKSDPTLLEQSLIDQFSNEEGFIKRLPSNDEKENIFKLTYENTPVLLAPLMDYQQLYWAKQHYDNGRKFYVVCFPDQAKFIRKIMPDVEFL